MSLLLGSIIFLVLCAGLLGPWERCFPRDGRGTTWQVNTLCIGLFIVNAHLLQVVGIGLSTWSADLIPVNSGTSTVRLIAALVLADLCAYGIHRAAHAIPALWRFHCLHHEPGPMTWLVAWRQHPVDALLHTVAVGLPGMALGVDLSDMVGLVLLRKLWTSILHADMQLEFPAVVSWLIVTPDFHHRHHRCEPAFLNRNFSGTLSIWDVLFGTLAANESDTPVTNAQNMEMNTSACESAGNQHLILQKRYANPA
jgi:sterol desaturase/sphingolipid hydroxylase (fatty acid hydroxylase superfamily)